MTLDQWDLPAGGVSLADLDFDDIQDLEEDESSSVYCVITVPAPSLASSKEAIHSAFLNIFVEGGMSEVNATSVTFLTGRSPPSNTAYIFPTLPSQAALDLALKTGSFTVQGDSVAGRPAFLANIRRDEHGALKARLLDNVGAQVIMLLIRGCGPCHSAESLRTLLKEQVKEVKAPGILEEKRKIFLELTTIEQCHKKGGQLTNTFKCLPSPAFPGAFDLCPGVLRLKKCGCNITLCFTSDCCNICVSRHKTSAHDLIPRLGRPKPKLGDSPLSVVKDTHILSLLPPTPKYSLILHSPSIALISFGARPERWVCLLEKCRVEADGKPPMFVHGNGAGSCLAHMRAHTRVEEEAISRQCLPDMSTSLNSLLFLYPYLKED